MPQTKSPSALSDWPVCLLFSLEISSVPSGIYTPREFLEACSWTKHVHVSVQTTRQRYSQIIPHTGEDGSVHVMTDSTICDSCASVVCVRLPLHPRTLCLPKFGFRHRVGCGAWTRCGAACCSSRSSPWDPTRLTSREPSTSWASSTTCRTTSSECR